MHTFGMEILYYLKISKKTKCGNQLYGHLPSQME
jgi:hypothetical protein